MFRKQHAQPLPLILTIPGSIGQGCGAFVLPLLVGAVAIVAFESSEVIETLPAMLGFALLVLTPVSFFQLVGTVLKCRRDIRLHRGRGRLTAARVGDIIFRHSGVITLRGWTLLLVALFFTCVALCMHWASFGLIAVIGLFLFYLVTGWTVFVSTFLARSFERGMNRSASGIQRQVVPAVVSAGESVEECFTFRRVRVPIGYTLIVEERLPERLQTESRYSVGPAASGGTIETRGRFHRTPRGFYRIGPARISYQDIFGITSVSVASAATAEVKVLPRLKSVQIVEPPRTPQETPDVVTRPHRFATEDHFQFREYAHGDDTRRIHWRLSMKTGRIQVRLPETREINAQDVLLVLDTYMPGPLLNYAAAAADDILDSLVDAWLGIARELIDRGDKVTLVAAVAVHEDDQIHIERLPMRRGQSARWRDLGARAQWQSAFEIPEMLKECGDEVHGVVATARFTAPPPGPLPGQDMTWLFLDPIDALGAPDPFWIWEVIGGPNDRGLQRALRLLVWSVRLPHAAGAEANSMVRRISDAMRRSRRWNARTKLREWAHKLGNVTLQRLLQRGDAVYKIEPTQTGVRLVGLQGQRGGVSK